MTKKKAILILIEHAASNCAGTGTGIRTIPSYQESKTVAEAILKVWPEKGYGPNFFNLGLPDPR